MSKDRHYYRSMSNKELLDEINYGTGTDWQELAIVLAERLEREERKEGRYCDDDD